MILIAATIAKPTQKSIASTLNPAIDRQLLIANIEEKSIFVLELKWSDEATKIVQLESVEDCYYNGSYIEDPDSTILITGCKLKNIQIQSPIFGDYLGTITANGKLKIAEEGYLIDDALENPDWNPTSNNVTIPEENNESQIKPTHEEPMAHMDCTSCEDNDGECWTKCFSNTETIQMKIAENIDLNMKPTYEEHMLDICGCGNDKGCWEEFLRTDECPGVADDYNYLENSDFSEENNESEIKRTHEEPMAVMDCEDHCEENDDECWSDCISIQTENQRKKRSDEDECGCGDDDTCWETLFQTGECPKTSLEFECGCEDWDKECWKYCLISTIVDAKETEGTAQFIDIASLFPKIVRLLGNIYGEFASDFASDFAFENSEFEGEPECECKDGDDDCWIYCLESTITIENSDDYETAQFFSIFGIIKNIFSNILG